MLVWPLWLLAAVRWVGRIAGAVVGWFLDHPKLGSALIFAGLLFIAGLIAWGWKQELDGIEAAHRAEIERLEGEHALALRLAEGATARIADELELCQTNGATLRVQIAAQNAAIEGWRAAAERSRAEQERRIAEALAAARRRPPTELPPGGCVEKIPALAEAVRERWPR
jgi:hypothetical protein